MSVDFVQELLVQTLNVSLMFSVGLAVEPRQLRAAVVRRRLLGVALLVSFVVVPLVAWGNVQLLALAPSIGAGFMLGALCPGGGTGTLLTRMARGNLELSIVLLGLSTVLAVPFLAAVSQLLPGAVGAQTLRLGPLVRTLLVYQLLPFLVGAALRSRSIGLASRLERFARPISNATFGVLTVGLLVARGHLMLSAGWAGVAAMVVVVAVSLSLGALGQAPRSDRAALSLTIGVRNLSLALLLSTAFFDDAATIAVLVYGLVMYGLGVPWALWLRAGERPTHPTIGGR